MIEILRQAMDQVQRLPAEARDKIVRIVLAYTGDDRNVIQLTPEEEASFTESLAQAGRHQFATAEEVEAVWAKYGCRGGV